MSEQAPTIERAPEAEAKLETVQLKPESGESKAAVEKQQHNQAEQARAVIENIKQPQPLALPVDDKADDNKPAFIDNAIKTLRLNQSLKHVQRRLKPTDRALSKVIHQPAVRKVSEVSAKTVSRPSGLLGGGVMAFVGSLAYLFLAKHIGFQYNYLLFTVFFVGGFALGLAAELVLNAARPKAAKS
jgi:hypothetical protein